MNNDNVSLDALIYLFFKIIEGVLGIVTLSLYTKVFTEGEMGSYTLINTTLTFFIGFSSTWITGSIFRYISKNKNEDEYKEFFSTIYVTYIFIIIVVPSVIFYLGNTFLSTSKTLIVIAMYSSTLLVQINLAISTSLRQIKLNSLISIIASVGKLVFFVLAINYYNHSIWSIFIINIILAVILNIIIIIKIGLYKKINVLFFNINILKKFFKYGYAFFGTVTISMILNISDRYLILYFFDIESVGIYTANYTIISTSFIMINYSVARATTPKIMELYNKNKVTECYNLIVDTVKYYIILTTPIIFGVVLLSKDISEILFKESYIYGSSIMVWVTLGYIFSFLLDFSNKAYELGNNTKKILRNSTIAGFLNLILNIFLMERFGYLVAGFVTFISYSAYFLISYGENKRYYKFTYGLKFYVQVISSSIAMIMIISILKLFFGINPLTLFIYIFIGFIVYLYLIYYNGLIKEEINQIIRKIRKGA